VPLSISISLWCQQLAARETRTNETPYRATRQVLILQALHDIIFSLVAVTVI
jgi:hypothetical protein